MVLLPGVGRRSDNPDDCAKDLHPIDTSTCISEMLRRSRVHRQSDYLRCRVPAVTGDADTHDVDGVS